MGLEHFYDVLSKTLARYAAALGYSLVWGGYVSPQSNTLKDDILQICERYISQNIQGVFFAPFGFHPHADQINREIVNTFTAASVPIVLLDANVRPHPAPTDFDLVSLDNFHAGYVMTEYLLQQGIRRLFFFAPPNSHHSIRFRYMGFREALLDHGITPTDDVLIALARDDTEGVRRVIAERTPDGILCSNDITAINVMRSLEAIGIAVPNDIALAGFDNLSRAMLFPHAITSIEQPVDKISRTALTLMIERLQNPQKSPCRIDIRVVRLEFRKRFFNCGG
ncbi:MAG: hypothetical protein Ta2A_11650 [Treponemataceae bacterium]|nr:MAG: hypothetical protein Ta2A_11650 [Treponemataceae bacterium]